MCSASMGAEGSVTLQLREAVQAAVSESNADVDVFQAAGNDTSYDIVENGSRSQNITNPFFKASGLTSTTINKTETGT